MNNSVMKINRHFFKNLFASLHQKLHLFYRNKRTAVCTVLFDCGRYKHSASAVIHHVNYTAVIENHAVHFCTLEFLLFNRLFVLITLCFNKGSVDGHI